MELWQLAIIGKGTHPHTNRYGSHVHGQWMGTVNSSRVRRVCASGELTGGRASPRAVTRPTAEARPSARPCLPWAERTPGQTRTASKDSAFL